MPEIRIVYVDDINDEILSQYLNLKYRRQAYISNLAKQEVKKTYHEIRFDGEKGYESLLHDTRIRSANVILIDNHLFEERSAGTGKFSGKQFKVILRKLLPFVEVIVITQDKALVGDNIIQKFSGRHGEDSNLYYEKFLAPMLNRAIEEVIEFEEMAADLRQSADVEKALVEKILQSLQGDDSYDALTKKDIDNLIVSFKELKNSCGC